MAEGLARHYAQKLGLELEVASAGTRPEGYVHPNAITVMAEKGIDISAQRSKGFRSEELRHYDYVITLGCSDKAACPTNFQGVICDWRIDDPFGKSVEFYRQARDEIEQKVVRLIQEIGSLRHRGL